MHPYHGQWQPPGEEEKYPTNQTQSHQQKGENKQCKLKKNTREKEYDKGKWINRSNMALLVQLLTVPPKDTSETLQRCLGVIRIHIPQFDGPDTTISARKDEREKGNKWISKTTRKGTSTQRVPIQGPSHEIGGSLDRAQSRNGTCVQSGRRLHQPLWQTGLPQHTNQEVT